MIFEQIDIALVAVWLFFLFFALLVYYLQTENMREGYPLETDEGAPAPNQGPFPLPAPKTFVLPHGRGEKTVPDYQPEDRELPLEKSSPTQGFPFTPVGDPMEGGVGPASWAPRRDVPELDGKGHPKIVPMRHLDGFRHSAGNDPRGLPVVAADGGIVGKVTDMWIDEPEHLVRYLEAELSAEDGGGTRLIPIHFAKIWHDRVIVRSLFPQHFAGIPQVKSDRQITLLEEEKITAWFGGGTMYAHPSRMGS
ncbi:MAG: photosynthetic reaction center subunit H [Hasllibacter sp.]